MPGSNIKTEIQISVPFLCGLILFLLVDRTGLGGQMVLAALSHEIGHLLAMTVLGEQPQKIVFGSFGIRIEKRPGTRLSYHKEILIYAAGPAVNLLAAGLFAGHPAVCRVHLLLGIFNLLPVGVLDGGQILRCFWLETGKFERMRVIAAKLKDRRNGSFNDWESQISFKISAARAYGLDKPDVLVFATLFQST